MVNFPKHSEVTENLSTTPLLFNTVLQIQANG